MKKGLSLILASSIFLSGCATTGLESKANEQKFFSQEIGENTTPLGITYDVLSTLSLTTIFRAFRLDYNERKEYRTKARKSEEQNKAYK